MSLFDQIIKENNVISLEEGTAYIDNGKNGVLLFASPSTTHKYGKKAYFKICNNSTYSKSTKVARICFYEASYIIHKRDPHGKETWFLSSREIKMLNDILLQKPNNITSTKQTVWEELIYQFNKGVKDHDPTSVIPENLAIPDYSNLIYKNIKK